MQSIECGGAAPPTYVEPRLNGSLAEAEAHILHWYRLPQHTKSPLRRGYLRLGQYVWNMMGRANVSWPELFYTENPEYAKRLIRSEFNEIS